jgi:putative transposase
MAMELLYRVGGLKGVEIGEMMGVDYSTVSLGRKRLKEKLAEDKNFSLLMERIEKRISRLKI